MPSPSDSPHAGRRILVADDDEAIRDLIVRWLTPSGAEVRVARDGIEAVESLAEFRPEAMVLDLGMPGRDGFEVLEHMQEVDAHETTPTMVLTGRHTTRDVVRSFRLGARDYLRKPFREEQLLIRVSRLLRIAAGGPPDGPWPD